MTAARRMERAAAAGPNEQWSMDFVSDALFDGRRSRAPTLVDNSTRGALAVGQVVALRGPPCLTRVGNGPEFVSKVLDRWAYERGVTLDFSRAGKPTESYLAFVLSRLTFPGSLYLGLIALLPSVAFILLNANQNFPFGGTSILIIVGVGLDTVKQIESQLQQRNYEGFLR